MPGEVEQLGQQAGQEIKAGYDKVDRFFASTAEMMQAESQRSWYAL